MALNIIWVGFFVVAFIVALVRTIMGEASVFSDVINKIFLQATYAFELSIGLTGIMALWLGILRIGEKGGAIKFLSRLVSPLFTKLFPEVPKDHPAQGGMVMNFSANMLGLDNAATPIGLKAMNQLQEVNPNKETASNAQILFLVLNTSGLTLIPTTIIALRLGAHADNPTDIFIPILIATFFSSLAGLIFVSIMQKINLLQKTILLYLGTATAFIVWLIWYLSDKPKYFIEHFSEIASGSIIFGLIISFFILGIRKKLNLYEEFVEGAKEGFKVAIKIIPFLVAMLCAVGAFTESGAMGFLLDGLEMLFGLVLSDTRFVDALPTAIMKPLSGGGARAMMVESWGDGGELVDSFAGKLAATFQGSTETTFYVLAVYFGAVGIKNTRYAVVAGLFADLVGIIAAIVVAYLFWG